MNEPDMDRFKPPECGPKERRLDNRHYLEQPRRRSTAKLFRAAVRAAAIVDAGLVPDEVVDGVKRDLEAF